MIRITVDRETCLGYGNCELVARGLFRVGEDGLVVVASEVVEDDRLDAVRAAAYDCPTASIAFEQLG